MNASLPWVARRVLLLALPVVLGCGCTSALWDQATFARQYGPACPANLRLFYSRERQDILVQYCELRDGETNARPRCYWLEPNTPRVNRNRKPHFVSAKTTRGLTPIPVEEGISGPPTAGLTQLHAMIGHEQDVFTLYSGTEELDAYKLPVYTGSSQKVKQVLLTPFAVAVDATIVGAVFGYYSAPEILAGLSR